MASIGKITVDVEPKIGSTGPLPVYITEPKLTGSQAMRFLSGQTMLWLIRALIVWGFLAIFFPTLGATYVVVLFGLWALYHAMPTTDRRRLLFTAVTRK